MIRERMGKLLLEAGLVSEQQLSEALQIQGQNKSRLGRILVNMGAISENTLLQFLGQQYGVPTVDMSSVAMDRHVAKIVPGDLAKQYLVVPIRCVGSRLTLAMVDPSNITLIEEIRFRTGLSIVPMVAMESEVLKRISQLCDGHGGPHPGVGVGHEGDPAQGHVSERSFSEKNEVLQSRDLELLLQEATSSIPCVEEPVDSEGSVEKKAPIVKLVNGMLRHAVEVGASDIHLEPYETFVRVRMRLDGVLSTVMTLPIKVRNAVISRIKILSNLDIAERRLPQDGRVKLNVDTTREVDVRVSVLPCLHGEKVVLRILDRTSLDLDLSKLGFDDQDLATFVAALDKPYGMMLVTGPTGSGKTTTLYSALQILNTPGVDIVTVEDPVEYHFTGVNQVQVKEEIGLNFAAALRSFLRQDPDIVMVGEIRDQETAQIAVKAALTGHRVLSTVHTNDAPRTITRLLEMGIEPFMVSSSVTLIIAQRLVEKFVRSVKNPNAFPSKDYSPSG